MASNVRVAFWPTLTEAMSVSFRVTSARWEPRSERTSTALPELPEAVEAAAEEAEVAADAPAAEAADVPDPATARRRGAGRAHSVAHRDREASSARRACGAVTTRFFSRAVASS